jgi:sulfoxide reductase heme-binding subunit YedZ
MARDPVRIAKPFVFFAGLAPLLWLLWTLFVGLGWIPATQINDGFGANPRADIRNLLGEWSLRLMLATLAITPLRRISGWNGAIRFRRMIGLFAFFYGFLHFVTYFILDQGFELDTVLHDIGQRPFITVGFLSFVLMVPLAVTSTKKWIGRLGGRRWQQLHYLLYPSAILGVLHYLWLVKLDIGNPLKYAAVLAVLLGWRVWIWIRGRIRAVKTRSAVL